jgi:hypothetical protein
MMLHFLVADLTPRSIQRLTHAFRIMKIIWHGQKEPLPELKHAYMLLLAMSMSKCNTLLHGMLEFFDEMEKLPYSQA